MGAGSGLAIINRMVVFSDGVIRNTKAIVAAEGLNNSRVAGDAIAATFRITFRTDGEASRTPVKRWKRHEFGTQPVASAADVRGQRVAMSMRLTARLTT